MDLSYSILIVPGVVSQGTTIQAQLIAVHAQQSRTILFGMLYSIQKEKEKLDYARAAVL